MSKSLSLPPLKAPFAANREREFLYLKEVDILIAATQNMRAGTRNAALAMLLFSQALQPVEIGWLRWCDVDFNKNTRQVIRNRTKSSQSQPLTVNRQCLSNTEVVILKELPYLSTTDWLLQSERRQRLSERSIYHIIASSGAEAGLPFPVHPLMLKLRIVLSSGTVTGTTWAILTPMLPAVEPAPYFNFFVSPRRK